MVPLEDGAIGRVLARDEGGALPLSLRHALIHRRPGLLGDHRRWPRSVLLVREEEGSGGVHAFGAGAAEPAVNWLAGWGKGRSVLIRGPSGWEGAIRRRGGAVGRGVVETWGRPGPSADATTPRALTRRLELGDEAAFLGSAPGWALLGWGSFARLIERGAAFGVPGRDGGLGAVAWVFEADVGRDAIAVATPEPFRRLGLGRAAASALLGHVEGGRRKDAAWVVAAENVASRALARSVGLSPRSREVVLRWEPGGQGPPDAPAR